MHGTGWEADDRDVMEGGYGRPYPCVQARERYTSCHQISQGLGQSPNSNGFYYPLPRAVCAVISLPARCLA